MTSEQRECMDSMPVRFREDGTLPDGAPDAETLSHWEEQGWIIVIDDPPRWALTATALATWGAA